MIRARLPGAMLVFPLGYGAAFASTYSPPADPAAALQAQMAISVDCAPAGKGELMHVSMTVPNSPPPVANRYELLDVEALPAGATAPIMLVHVPISWQPGQKVVFRVMVPDSLWSSRASLIVNIGSLVGYYIQSQNIRNGGP